MANSGFNGYPGKGRAMTDETGKIPAVRIKPNGYQPSRAELEKPMGIDASPEDVIRAAFRQVRVIRDPDA